MRVFVTRALPGNALTRLESIADIRVWPEDRPIPPDLLHAEVAAADGLLCTVADRIGENVLAHAPRLRVISNYGVGVDNIDIAAATARRIPVCNTPDVLTDATADIAIGLMIAACRRWWEAERLLRENRWGSWSPTLLLGQPFSRRILGIVGLGKIGQAVARRARGFGMEILYAGRRRPETEKALGLAWCSSLDELLRDSDIVSLHVPLTPATRHLIGARELALMKPTAVLVNTSRGAVVDQAALAEALREQRIFAAGLDVYEEEPLPPTDPLRELDNCILLPHIGSAEITARLAMADLAVDNLQAVLEGRRPRACVNPEVLS
ncbi:MAG: D-glycerate dehydrogenase [Chloroflexota bacterium]|nr:D-glycerate dehydrogenase [Dehalococcoidia bacterium]MDW8254017.1 D-glycerate dehydrogenase [Chloroflexota bacterium]